MLNFQDLACQAWSRIGCLCWNGDLWDLKVTEGTVVLVGSPNNEQEMTGLFENMVRSWWSTLQRQNGITGNPEIYISHDPVPSIAVSFHKSLFHLHHDVRSHWAWFCYEESGVRSSHWWVRIILHESCMITYLLQEETKLFCVPWFPSGKDNCRDFELSFLNAF